MTTSVASFFLLSLCSSDPAILQCGGDCIPALGLPLVQPACLLCRAVQVQGDMERAAGLPASPMCDRTKATMPQSQLNFIEFVVAPLYVQASSLYLFVSHTDCLHVQPACGLFWLWACYA